MSEKLSEPVRLAQQLITDALQPLTVSDRLMVFAHMETVAAHAAVELISQLDESRETAEEWKRHNDQRLEEVYEARVLLGAQPNESLPIAILRVCGSLQDRNG